MLIGMNKAYLMGRAGRDAELGELPGEARTPVCKVSICTPTARRRVDGQWVEDVDWHTLIAYNSNALEMSAVRKGVGVMVECKISPKKCTDAKRTVHYRIDLLVTKVLWIDGVSKAPDLGDPPAYEAPLPDFGPMDEDY